MKRKLLSLVALICFSSSLIAQTEFQKHVKTPIKYQTINGDEFIQRDLTAYVINITDNTDNEMYRDEDQKAWINYANAPHPSVKTLHKYFQEAANEFGVPVELLKAIGQVENNWMQIGPTIDRGWGIMHLVDNDYCSSLKEAAALIKQDVQVLKDNAKQNIRGAAALLKHYAGPKSAGFNKIEDWFEAAKLYTGLINEDLQELQAENYFKVLKEGKVEMTVWEEYVVIDNYSNIDIENKLFYKSVREANSKAVDYPGAVAEFTTCNYSSRNGTKIDAWVNHYIGTGTIAGALSWFKNCSAQVSAHFCLSVNGTLYQSVNVANKAWHCGAVGYDNNGRSIGIEHDVTTSTPNNWNNTTMLNKSAEVTRYFCNMYSIPKTRSLPGIRGHKEMPGTNTSCPGNLPWDTWMSLLNEGSTPPVPSTPTAGQTGVNVPVPFTWTSTVASADFRIQVSTTNSGWTATNGFTTSTSPSSTVVVNANTGTTKSYNWQSGATGSYSGPVLGSTYYWTVRQYSASTGTSQYSAVRSFTVKNLTPIAFDNFDVNTGHFSLSPTYSGTTVGISSTSTWERVTDLPQAGAGCMRGIFYDDAANTTNWKARLLSGGGTPANNVSVSKNGKISFWMKTSTANTGATVCLWIDDSDGTEQSVAKAIANTGNWTLYEFDLTNFQGTAVTGNGVINGPNVTLDAIILQRPHATTNWYFWVDEVIYTPTAKGESMSLSEYLSPIKSMELNIYPNPANDYIDIVNENENAIAYLLDINGRTISEVNLTKSNNRMDLTSIPAGVYIVKVIDGNQVKTTKLLKK